MSLFFWRKKSGTQANPNQQAAVVQQANQAQQAVTVQQQANQQNNSSALYNALNQAITHYLTVTNPPRKNLSMLNRFTIFISGQGDKGQSRAKEYQEKIACLKSQIASQQLLTTVYDDLLSDKAKDKHGLISMGSSNTLRDELTKVLINHLNIDQRAIERQIQMRRQAMISHAPSYAASIVNENRWRKELSLAAIRLAINGTNAPQNTIVNNTPAPGNGSAAGC